MARGGEVLAPERPDFPVQLIDARDIARFALEMAEGGDGGVFNLCAPQEPHRSGDLLEAAARIVGQTDLHITWVSAEFLLENGLSEWEALPWWSPPQEIALSRFDASRALAAGLMARRHSRAADRPGAGRRGASRGRPCPWAEPSGRRELRGPAPAHRSEASA